MKDKNHLAKLALAGLLVAANLPAGAQADAVDSKVVYLAVAGCASHGCGGQKSQTPPSSQPNTNAYPSQNANGNWNQNQNANSNWNQNQNANSNWNQNQNANPSSGNPTNTNWDANRR